MESHIHQWVVVYYDDGHSILVGLGCGSVLPLRIYFRPITGEKSHCQLAIQHADEERSICKRDWAIQGEAIDYVDVLTRVWGTHWNIRLLLDLLTVISLGAVLLRRLANLIPSLFSAHYCIFTGQLYYGPSLF